MNGGKRTSKKKSVIKDPKVINKNIKGKTPVIVLYYMNGCGHCEMLRPTWNECANKLCEMPNIIVAEVESANLKDVATGTYIEGFPTIVAYKGKEIKHFGGQRTYEGIMDFANELVGGDNKIVYGGRSKKVHKGPKGGKYIIVNGNKRYI